MAHWKEMFGEKLLGKGGEVSTVDALAGKKAVAIYFSAHWCPPCRGFTPVFAQGYKDHLRAKGLEVVFASSDRDEDQFKEYYGEQPWLALPFANRDAKAKLSAKYKVQGIPTVVILDEEGKVITTDGREAVSSDLEGKDFPWKPKSLAELLEGIELVDNSGNKHGKEAIVGKVFGLYFSAHWCGPCRAFTPQLAAAYKKDLKAKGLEIVFVSSDRDENSFKEYFAEQPWLALPFSDRDRKNVLSRHFQVSGIPTFVIVDKDLSVIDKDGRRAVGADPEGKEFPWYPKPVTDLAHGPGEIQEMTSIVAFCDGCPPEEAKKVEEALTAVAAKHKAEHKDDPQFAFFIAKSSGGIAGRLRQIMFLPALPPNKHEHPLEKKGRQDGWGCDGCGKGQGSGTDRYRCTSGCDFDYCGDCYAKAYSGPAASAPAQLMVLDIPDSGGFYQGPSGDITSAVVQKLLDDYNGKKLDRKQLDGSD